MSPGESWNEENLSEAPAIDHLESLDEDAASAQHAGRRRPAPEPSGLPRTMHRPASRESKTSQRAPRSRPSSRCTCYLNP